MEFELFSKLHFIYLLGYTVFFILLFYIVKFSSNPKHTMSIIGLSVLSLKCIELFVRYNVIGEAWTTILPLHLCNIVLIFAILGSIFRFTPFIDAAFFWSIGAIFAIITPEVRETFPSFFNISFFVTHFFIIFNVFVEYILFKYRPTASSWLGCLFGLNLIAASVYFINLTINTNYLYINHKPSFKSPIDALGPWPTYIGWFEVIYIVLSLAILIFFKEKKTKYSKYSRY